MRANADRLGVELPDDRRFHVHFPAGATLKDGPSAGVAMTVALVSLLCDQRVRGDVAMTGEVTLRGRVLPIGGVKEKVLAAHRAGVTDVILPIANGRDVDDISDEVRDVVTIHLVSTVDEALDVALAV
ncbi:MAG: magnesium chelatase domain-containing protein [Acidimicrobiales bacterium]|nr:magnesium chelatase domain-containing protein [Acidimicrobiales bacterium]